MKATSTIKPSRIQIIHEWICVIGTILVYVVLSISFFLINVNIIPPISATNPEGILIWEIIWDSVFSILSASIAIVDVVASWLLIRFLKSSSKVRIIFLACFTYLICIFNNVAIKYPLPVSLSSIINVVLFSIMCIVVLLTKNNNKNILYEKLEGRKKIYNIISKNSNKKIIAIQMYSVTAKSFYDEKGTEKINYHVISREYSVKNGHDINSIASIDYTLERNRVDRFKAVLELFQTLIDNGDDETKDKILKKITNEIVSITDVLKQIDGDSITKEHCCLARLLVLYITLKQQLFIDSSQNLLPNYLGEATIAGKELGLDLETEERLFTMVRTGILGAILLDENLRHIFYYRKNGNKTGRKYCASQVYCENLSKNTEVNQKMDIGLYTIEDEYKNGIAPYVLRNIDTIDGRILTAIHSMINEGGVKE